MSLRQLGDRHFWGVSLSVTTAEVLDVTPAAGPVPSGTVKCGTVQFLGRERAYWRLRLKGALLVMITLGIYRFWLATDVRRFLWSNTEIAGDTLEYNGLATELLTGFLLAIAILAPLYTAIAVVTLELGAAGVSAAAAFLILAFLGEFALYRARRYRLTRTVFRGLRFDQHGPAWYYAVRALAWWGAVIVTLGLAYPWMQASLERFKMHNTSFGDLHGRFEGSGAGLFLRGLPIWLLVVGPLVVALAAFVALTDWDTLTKLQDGGSDDSTAEIMGAALFRGSGTVPIAIAASALALVLLYPLFQAIVLRWWLSGLRFGPVSVTSRLRAGKVYRVYIRFVLYLLLFGIATLVAVVVGLALVGDLVSPRHDSSASEIVASLITVGLYVATALGISVIYQVVVAAGMWRLGAQSVELAGIEALDEVRAEGAPSSALGEGLADALGVGGI